jgi:hypothetical protein
MPIWAEKCLKSFFTASVAEVKIQLRGVPSRWPAKIGAIDSGVLCSCRAEAKASTHSTASSPSTTLPFFGSDFQASCTVPAVRPRARGTAPASRRARPAFPARRSGRRVLPSAFSSAGKKAESARSAAATGACRCREGQAQVARGLFDHGHDLGPVGAAARMRQALGQHVAAQFQHLRGRDRLAEEQRGGSGSWCASSKMMVLADGSSSATPVSFSATSAKNRWWLTTTTSACWASRRAFITKQSW